MNMTEIWKPVVGFEGSYEVSNHGRVRSIPHYVNGKNPYTHKPFKRLIKGKILNPTPNNSGHMTVVLKRGTPSRQVHRLVIEAFEGPCPKGLEVLHTDGNPQNNHLSNLRYGTRTENILDVFRIGKAWRKLTTEDVFQIRERLKAGATGAEIAHEFSISQSQVSNIRNGKNYSWLN